jgi:hypothetical protein
MDDAPGAGDLEPGEVTARPSPAARPGPAGDPGRPLPDLMAIHLADLPLSWPPYDDELPGRLPAEPEGYSPAVMWNGGEPAAPEVPAPGPEGEGDADADTRQAGGKGGGSASGRAGSTPDGDGDRWPSQFAQVLAETLAGSRPASQITPWTTERARAHIRRLGPLLAAGQRPRVQRVLASRPVEDVVEVAVVVGFGPRTRALAARLERAGPQPATPGRPARQARWLCTDVESA